MARRKVVSTAKTPRSPIEGSKPHYGFDYTLECGHVVRGKDYRRWRHGILKEPKTIHCDECREKLGDISHEPESKDD